MNYRVLTVLRILFVLGLVAFVQSVNALTLEEQRKLYENAKKALQDGRVTAFLAMADQLQDYPLYPYLRYNYLSPRLYKVKPGEIQAFIRENNDFPLIDTLRTRWLRHLAKTGQWETYLENYTPQKDPELQCFELQARMKTGNRIYLLEDIRSVWLSGKSLPQQCDPAFALLYKS
ncbi:MAG TPA: hypothetical protein VLN56_00445, partial [Gammaproteobacteria bacterium]|nr:hypothetical protein [Gammaproteobacteria bacterium]